MAEPTPIHEDPFMPTGGQNAVPYDWGQARAVLARLSIRHAQAVKAFEEAVDERKKAKDLRDERERAYRQQLATEIIELKSHGVAITVAGDLARGGKDHRGRDTEAGERRYERDVAVGALKAADQLVTARAEDLRKAEKDRDDARELVRWSRDVAPNGEQRQPDGEVKTFGAGRQPAPRVAA